MGIGSRLVKEMEEKGQELGIGRLYLYTPAEHFYAALGWQVLERSVFRGHPDALMVRELR